MKFIINLENDNVRTVGATSIKGNIDGNINLYQAGLDEMYCKDEITEYLQEQHGEETEVVFESDLRLGQYTVSIEDLEVLGWDFSVIYDEVSDAMNTSRDEAEKYQKEKYKVIISLYEDQVTEYRMDAGSEFSNNEPTGNDEQTIEDLKQLISNGKIIDFITH